MRGQAGFFDIDERLREISAKGDDPIVPCWQASKGAHTISVDLRAEAAILPEGLSKGLIAFEK